MQAGIGISVAVLAVSIALTFILLPSAPSLFTSTTLSSPFFTRFFPFSAKSASLTSSSSLPETPPPPSSFSSPLSPSPSPSPISSWKMGNDWTVHFEALGWGVLSAVSLPLGALVGLWKPNLDLLWRSMAMAFGAGALLFALSLSLFGEALFHIATYGRWPVVVMIATSLLGGLLFLGLNALLENRGAFFRSFSLKKTYYVNLINQHFSKYYDEDEDDEDEPSSADESDKHGKQKTAPSPSPPPRRKSLASSSSPTATSPSSPRRVAFEEPTVVGHEEALRKKRELRRTFRKSLAAAAMDDKIYGSNDEQIVLTQEAVQALEPHMSASTVGLAIWLGILIDSFPESLVIGILTVSDKGMSYALILAVFLSNFPEALSSSIIMFESGLSRMRILLLWLSITITTGIGALIGSFLEFGDLPPNAWEYCLLRGIEGTAAGAMLVMITNTMLPEAFANGGNMTGLAALSGFIAALTVELAVNWDE